MSNKQISFKLKDIQILSKHLSEYSPSQVETIFQFDVRVEAKIFAEHKLVMYQTDVGIKSNLSKDNILANFSIGCIFDVVNFDETIVINDDGIYVLPNALDATCRPISISTARGIIYSELRGTYLHKAIMPVIMMDSFKILTPNDKSVEEIPKDKGVVE